MSPQRYDVVCVMSGGYEADRERECHKKESVGWNGMELCKSSEFFPLIHEGDG
jgi:hypothetical protein